MRSLYVPIPDDVAEQLRQVARREYRSSRAQAAVLLREALERRERDERKAVTEQPR